MANEMTINQLRNLLELKVLQYRAESMHYFDQGDIEQGGIYHGRVLGIVEALRLLDSDSQSLPYPELSQWQ